MLRSAARRRAACLSSGSNSTCPVRRRKFSTASDPCATATSTKPNSANACAAKGIFADHVQQLFQVAARKHGLNKLSMELSAAAFRKPGGDQLSLFEP
jgi:hypothetical protein